MRLSTIAVTLALSVPCLATAQSVEQELKKLETQWGDAIVKKDFAVLGRVLADDFTSTGREGDFWTKAQFIASVKSGEDILSSFALSDMKVHVYGDTAVVTYVAKQRRRYLRARTLAAHPAGRTLG